MTSNIDLQKHIESERQQNSAEIQIEDMAYDRKKLRLRIAKQYTLEL